MLSVYCPNIPYFPFFYHTPYILLLLFLQCSFIPSTLAFFLTKVFPSFKLFSLLSPFFLCLSLCLFYSRSSSFALTLNFKWDPTSYNSCELSCITTRCFYRTSLTAAIVRRCCSGAICHKIFTTSYTNNRKRQICFV